VGRVPRNALKVQKERFETIYVLPPSFSSGLFSFLTRIRKRRGIASDGRASLLTQALPRTLRDASRHLTYEYAHVLETDFVPPEYWQGVKLDKPETHAGRVVFCPGSKYGPAKRWMGFPKLAEILVEKEIVVLGDGGDADAAEPIETVAPDRVINLCGETSLAEAARIISSAKVVVANDQAHAPGRVCGRAGGGHIRIDVDGVDAAARRQGKDRTRKDGLLALFSNEPANTATWTASPKSRRIRLPRSCISWCRKEVEVLKVEKLKSADKFIGNVTRFVILVFLASPTASPACSKTSERYERNGSSLRAAASQR